MSDVVPINEDAEVRLNLPREMVDYCQNRLAIHQENFNEPADTIAIVTMSRNGRLGHSFSMKAEQDRLATCASAAAILLERAVSS